MRQRNNNLIQINQTLTQALGESSKNSGSSDYDKRVEEISKELQQKNKKILTLEDTISKI